MLENAFQATDPAKGHVGIHAAFDPYSSRVVVTVSDNGCGMDEETAKRAFDPFYSDKPAGRQRGLGLAKATALDRGQRRIDPAREPARTGNADPDSAPRGHRQSGGR